MPLYKNPDFLRPVPGLFRIFDSSDQRSFFALPQWYDLLARFGVTKGTEIRVYTNERPGSGLALPLQVETCNRQFSLCSLASFYSIEHGVISSGDASCDGALPAVAAEIVAETPRWDCIRLMELDPSDASYGALVRALRQVGFFVECTVGAATWFELTDGMSFADYLAQRPSRLRNTWNRKRRSIAATGRLTASFFSEASEIDVAIADYQTVYAASWKQPEPFPDFMPALIRVAAGLGALRMGVYYIEGMPAAAQFWIVWQQRAVIYKLAHDRRLDALSLGTLLTMDMVERVLEQDRPSEINFGRGDDPYKSLWLPRRRERWGITAANPRTIRGLRLGLARETAKLYHWLRGEPVTPNASPVGSNRQQLTPAIQGIKCGTGRSSWRAWQPRASP